MRIGIGIFVKTPGHSPLKTRLAAGIGSAAAERFHMLGARAVAAVVREAQQLVPGIAPHWAVAEPAALDADCWNDFPRIAQGDGDLGQRMGRVCDALLDRFDAALLLGADTPQIESADLAAAADALPAHPHVLGPSADGGFWLFATRGEVPPAAWNSTPWSQADTADRFCDAVAGMADATAMPRLRRLRDVDTADDLPPLLSALDGLAAPLPEQVTLARWMRRSGFA